MISRSLRIPTGLAIAAIVATAWTGQAAAQSSKLIQNMDVNKDGKVQRDEIPEGAVRRMFDNIVEKFKLDPKKTYAISEIEQAMGLTVSSSTRAASTSSSTSRSRRSFGRSSSSITRAPSDGRPFRALEELPDTYRSHDKDGDGQIGLYEWPRDRIPDFLALDANDDGFLTLDELKKPASTDSKTTAINPSEEKKDAEQAPEKNEQAQ